VCAERPTILHIFSTFAVGGAQRIARMLVEASVDRFRHLIVALDGRFDAARSLEGVGLVDGRGLTDHRARRRFLRAHRPALLVTCNWGSFDWVLAAHLPTTLVPHLHAEHGFGADETRRRRRRRDLARILLLRRARALVVPSRTLVRLATEHWHLPPARVRWIPNGVPLDGPVARPAETGGAPARVVTVAPLRPEKRLDLLLEAVARAEVPVELVVVGDGPERARLQARARRHDLLRRVRFVGAVDDPRPWLARAQLFALSSDTEQMPLALLEAMAAGLPVVARAVGDVRSMVAPPNRPYIVAGEAPDALARALAALAASPDLRAELGRANRRRCRRLFGLERMIDAYLGLFETLVAAGCENRRAAGGMAPRRLVRPSR